MQFTSTRKTLVLSDFDFTMWPHGDDRQIHENLDAIIEFRRNGGRFGIATGRGLNTLRREFPSFVLFCDYLVDLDGTLIYQRNDDGDMELIDGIKIPAREVEQMVCQIKQSFPAKKRRDAIYFEREMEMKKWKSGQHLSKIRVWCSDEEDAVNLGFAAHDLGLNAYIFRDIPLQNNFDYGRLKWVHDDVRHALDILPRDVGKSAGISLLKTHLANDVEIVTVGDDVNDIGMVTDFDGYAVNPKPELRAKVPEGKIKSSLAEVLREISP